MAPAFVSGNSSLDQQMDQVPCGLGLRHNPTEWSLAPPEPCPMTGLKCDLRVIPTSTQHRHPQHQKTPQPHTSRTPTTSLAFVSALLLSIDNHSFLLHSAILRCFPHTIALTIRPRFFKKASKFHQFLGNDTSCGTATSPFPDPPTPLTQSLLSIPISYSPCASQPLPPRPSFPSLLCQSALGPLAPISPSLAPITCIYLRPKSCHAVQRIS